MKLLWLANWYPDKLSPYNGDFIRRHAQAVSLYHDVELIYVTKDTEGVITGSVHEELHKQGRLTERIIYYYTSPALFSSLHRIRSYVKYRSLYRKAIMAYAERNGLPDVIHVHAGMKAADLGRKFSSQWNVPLVMSEHWSGFLEHSGEKFSDLSQTIRGQWSRALEHASVVTAVSEVLVRGLQNNFPFLKKISRIPNVVDASIFNYDSQPVKSKSFIHISGLDDLKNPFLLLDAFRHVLTEEPDSFLRIIGSKRKAVMDYAEKTGISSHVSFSEEIPQEKLAAEMKKSCALLLFSAYETFGCVVIEANASGLPVVVSDIPALNEIVRDKQNGIIVKSWEATELARGMLTVLRKEMNFVPALVSESAIDSFGYKKVGKMFSDLYVRIRNGQG